MSVDFELLKQKIETAVKLAFTEMYEKHKDEQIYAFALYSDEGAMTVCPATNTLKYLEENEEEDDIEYYKFDSVEWKYEMQGADELFNEISKLCYKEVDENEYDENGDADDEWFNTFQTQLYDSCIEVLQKLKNEDFFKNICGEDIFLNFSVTEYEFPEEKLKSIVESLNDNKYKDEYLNWVASWNED